MDGGEPSASRVRGRRELRNEETKEEDPEHANKGEVKKHTTKHSAHAKKVNLKHWTPLIIVKDQYSHLVYPTIKYKITNL